MPTARSGRSDGVRCGGAFAPLLVRFHEWAVAVPGVANLWNFGNEPNAARPGVVAVTRNLLEPDQPRPRSRRWVVPDVAHSCCE